MMNKVHGTDPSRVLGRAGVKITYGKVLEYLVAAERLAGFGLGFRGHPCLDLRTPFLGTYLGIQRATSGGVPSLRDQRY